MKDPISGLDVISFSVSSSLGISMGNVAQLLGVDHFNFKSEVTALPSGWEVSIGGQVIKPFGGSLQSPLIDRIPAYSAGALVVTGAGMGIVPVLKTSPSELGEGYFTNSYAAAQNADSQITFGDKPAMPLGAYNAGQSMSFQTTIIGVDQNGQTMEDYHLGYRWNSDQTHDTNGGLTVVGHLSTLPGDPNVPNWNSGGIFAVELVDRRFDAPDSGFTIFLLLVGLVSLAGVQRMILSA
jgi:hypothetical protein